MNKVIRMCIIHDLGEAFTGDIPTFEKTASDETAEEGLLSRWVNSLPEQTALEMRSLYAEMSALQTPGAKPLPDTCFAAEPGQTFRFTIEPDR